jgi:xylulokinase
VRCEQVVLCGGGAASALWTQLRADVLRLPHRRAAQRDSTAVAAAMLTAVATSAVRLDELGALAGAPDAGADPDPARADESEQAYQRYRELSAALLGSRLERELDDDAPSP